MKHSRRFSAGTVDSPVEAAQPTTSLCHRAQILAVDGDASAITTGKSADSFDVHPVGRRVPRWSGRDR